MFKAHLVLLLGSLRLLFSRLVGYRLFLDKYPIDDASFRLSSTASSSRIEVESLQLGIQ
jgi:hypothetical protein